MSVDLVDLFGEARDLVVVTQSGPDEITVSLRAAVEDSLDTGNVSCDPGTIITLPPVPPPADACAYGAGPGHLQDITRDFAAAPLPFSILVEHDATPEPSTVVLFAVGLGTLSAVRRMTAA
jgi:hypothetical protein